MLWNSPEVGGPLAILTAGMLFLTVQQASSGILQGMGRPEIPVRNLILGAAVKVLVTYVLTANPALNIRGAAIGSVLGFLTAATLNLTEVHVSIGEVLDVGDMIAKPAAAVIIMAIPVRMGYSYLLGLTGSNTVSTLSAVVIGIVVYGIAILLVGGVRKRDLEMIPGAGPWAASWLRNAGLLRD
jgi:stage V sporulation protein B